MRIGKIGVVVIGLVPFNVNGECTPTPDCASIGYTETSCEGAFIKCPFDTSKLYCVPCDSSFKYTCSGENITGGTGSACGGKYVSCECEGGLPFNNGICPQNCTVGMIYYSDRTCSTELDSNKTAIGVVVKDNELVVSQRLANDMTWGGYGTDISTLANYSSSTDAKTDFNGKANTALIVAAHTSAGLTSSESAAIYCNEYSTEGTNAGDWYLPAAGELYKYVYGGGTNYSKINTTMTTLGWTFGSRYFWSSSELSANLACLVYSDYGYVTNDSKNYNYAVSCFLDIS